MKLDKNSPLKDIQKEAKRLNSIIEKQKDKQRIEENSAYIGKCFKFENSYGGEKPKKWFGYMVATGIDENGFLLYTQFEVDCDGVPSMRKSFFYWASQCGYQEVPRSVVDKAWEKFIAATNALKP